MTPPNAKWLRIAQGIVVAVILACGAGLIRNGNRITALETHIPYIREALTRIESGLKKKR